MQHVDIACDGASADWLELWQAGIAYAACVGACVQAEERDCFCCGTPAGGARLRDVRSIAQHRAGAPVCSSRLFGNACCSTALKPGSPLRQP